MSKQKTYDVIVIGTGSMGSATSYYLANQGIKVLGIDRYAPPHTMGSHTGQSRIIRMAYFEDLGYVPLLERSYVLWKELEDITEAKHFHKTGLQYYGRESEMLINGVLRSAQKYNLDIDQNTQYNTQLTIPQDLISVYEPNAGYIIPENTISTYIELAKKEGAEFKLNEEVVEWKASADSVTVKTDKQTYVAQKVIITAGAWAKKLMDDHLPLTLNVTKQSLFWVEPKKAKDFQREVFPCWNIQDPDHAGLFYGFPVLEYRGKQLIKLAHHIENVTIDPDKDDRGDLKKDKDIIQYALDTYFQNRIDKIIESKTCLYANSSDGNFVIDYAEGYNDQVIYACGFSGHGFKFVPVIGKILSELAVEGKTDSPIAFLSAKRFQ